jgi:hypothetical protein
MALMASKFFLQKQQASAGNGLVLIIGIFLTSEFKRGRQSLGL